MKIERANRRTDKAQVREYRFREAQLIVRDNPSLPVEIEALAGVQFNSSEVVARALRNLVHMDQETFIALHLNGRLKVSALTVVSIGTISTSLVHPREVFRSAILAGATGIIGVHNHPSGDPAPSHEDRAITSGDRKDHRDSPLRPHHHRQERPFQFRRRGIALVERPRCQSASGLSGTPEHHARHDGPCACFGSVRITDDDPNTVDLKLADAAPCSCRVLR